LTLFLDEVLGLGPPAALDDPAISEIMINIRARV